MTQEMLNYYHDRGDIPDKYFYQLNGKSAQDNYMDQKRKRFRLGKKQFNFFEDFVMAMVKSCLEVALKEVMDGLIPTK